MCAVHCNTCSLHPAQMPGIQWSISCVLQIPTAPNGELPLPALDAAVRCGAESLPFTQSMTASNHSMPHDASSCLEKPLPLVK